MNDYNGKFIKKERIDNSNGSYITKEVYEDNTSCIRYWDKNKNNVKCEFYTDHYFENLEMTSENKFKKDGSYVSKNVYKEPTTEGYQSIMGWFDSKHQAIKTKEFYDNNFKILMNYEERKYNNDGSCLVIVHRYFDNEYYKMFYNEKGKLYEYFFYSDKKFNNLIITYKRIYNADNSYKEELFFESFQENGVKYGIKYYNSDGLLLRTQYFLDKSCEELITDAQIKYNDDLSCTEYKKYYKGTYGIYQDNMVIHSEIIDYNKNNQVIFIKGYSDLEFKNLLHTYNIEYLKNRWEKHTIIYSKPQLEDDGQICEIQIKKNQYQYQNIKRYADSECKNIISETIFLYIDSDSHIAKKIYYDKSKYNYIIKYAGYDIKTQAIAYSDDNFKIPIEKRTFFYNNPDNKKSKEIIIEHLQEHYSELKKYDINEEVIQTKKCNFTGFLALLTLYPNIGTNILLPIVCSIGLIPVYLKHMPSFFVIVHALLVIFCTIVTALLFKEFYNWYYK